MPPAPADFPADLPADLPRREVARLRTIWPDLTTPERERLVADLNRLAALRTEIATQQEAYERRQQIQRNQGLRAFAQARLAEAAAMTPEERAAADAEWEEFKQTMNANRVPEPPLFP